jgi:DNA polymerase I
MSSNFSTIVVADFEYEVGDGELPNVLCMVAYVLNGNLEHVRTIRLWRGEFGSTPPFDIGPDTLFVAYSAWAEMTCFQVLGWRFPVNIFDQHAAYLAASNVLLPYDPDEKRKRQSKGLSAACRAYGIKGWESMDKGTIAKDIGEGRWWIHGKEACLDYCEEDTRNSMLLLYEQLLGRRHLPRADVPLVLHWSEYSAKAVAQIQARGMPVDMPLWNTVQEHKAAVVGALLKEWDPSHGDDDPIYTPEGEWSYDRFEQWLVRAGVRVWPRLDSGLLNVDSDAFRLMYGVHPGIEGLHALRDSLGFIVRARLPIGKDGRNRPSLFPFCTATGRNAHAKSPYNAHAAVRSFMLCPPSSTMAYLDWRSQEVGVAAYLSGDERLMADYLGGDVYHALGRMCGLTEETDPIKWKSTEPALRNRMKPLQLGINYGMGVPSLARGLNRHPIIASTIIELHKRTYPRFWSWRAGVVQRAMEDRQIESIRGWSLRISTSPNKRTLYNFPMQSNGAEMLREAAVKLCAAGIVPIMLVHDGILFEEMSPERIEHAREIMLKAGRDVCGGFEIGVDFEQRLQGNERYCDKRPVAKKMWETIMNVLGAVGAWRKRA